VIVSLAVTGGEMFMLILQFIAVWPSTQTPVGKNTTTVFFFTCSGEMRFLLLIQACVHRISKDGDLTGMTECKMLHMCSYWVQQHELSHCLHLMMRHCVVCVRVRENDSVPYVPIMFLADSMCVSVVCVCVCGLRLVVLQTTHEKPIRQIKSVSVLRATCLGVHFY